MFVLADCVNCLSSSCRARLRLHGHRLCHQWSVGAGWPYLCCFHHEMACSKGDSITVGRTLLVNRGNFGWAPRVEEIGGEMLQICRHKFSRSTSLFTTWPGSSLQLTLLTLTISRHIQCGRCVHA
jgi:hypothetical protein